MSKPEEHDVKLTLRFLPSDVPAVNRLRAAMKTLLRVYRLRAVRVEDVIAPLV